MPKASEERTAARRDEIIAACEKLYETMGFRDVTIKEIGAATSFSRPTIYNYFETKEEIFLALLTKEYAAWADELADIAASKGTMDCNTLASKIAGSLSHREVMLKIMAMNLYEVEENSRIECLRDFKESFFRAANEMESCLRKLRPEMPEEDRNRFRYTFFPFMNGVYPYAHPTCKQCEAMDMVGICHPSTSVYELAYYCLIKLLK